MAKKSKLITVIRIYGMVSLIAMAVIIIGFDIYANYKDFRERSDRVRLDYVSQQKELIKREVEMVVYDIVFHKTKTEQNARGEVKREAYGVYNTVENIYEQNKQQKPKNEIQQTIVDVLKPGRYSNNMEHCFIISTSGKALLFKDKQDLKGKSLLNIQNDEGHYFAKDMLNLIKKSDEGFFNYKWNIKKDSKKDSERLYFIKLFKPYNWIIGVWSNYDSITLKLEKELIEKTASIKFGNEGYIFLNKWDGTSLVSNGKIISGNKKLWEVFGQEAKEVFDKELNAAKKPGGDFIYYKWSKLSNPDRVSPKVSFIYGIPEWKWIVGSGVYLDDVETEISTMSRVLKRHILNIILISIIGIAVILGIFIYITWAFNRRLKRDFNLFISFFKRAALSNEKIKTDSVRFAEFHELSTYANKMLADKVKAQHNLLEEKERLSVTLRSIGDGVIATDTSARVVLLNSVAEKLTGWNQEEAHGKALSDVFNIINEDTREKIKNPVERVITEGHIVGLANHSVLISRDGNEYNIMDSAAPIKDEKGTIHGVVLVFRDVTEQLKAEEELAKVNKLESIGVLAGGIAHDFNNILTGLFGNIKLAEMKLTKDHEAYEYLKTAGQALDRATNLTKQLLTFAKGGNPIIKTVDIQQIIKDSVTFNLSGSNVKAKYNFAENIWQVKADRGQISQVVANLTINAKEAMPEGGNLYINVENVTLQEEIVSDLPAGLYVKINFRDEGIGISRENLDKIFDPYFTTKEAGNGLGLATVHSIIKKHGGYITVDSKIGSGTSFTIYLQAEKASKTKAYNSGSDINADLKPVSGHILVVDDEEMIRAVAMRMLKILGYTVDFASEGREAVEKYISAKESGSPFNAVIMDLTIRGGMGGGEAVKEILSQDPDAVVIVSSGYSNDPIMANYGEYGFKGRIVKPFEMEALKTEISRVIRS